MGQSRGGRQGGWPVVAIHGAVAALVLVLVAVLALVVKPPAPPGIAAFAPQAAKPITKAPDTQSAQNGEGEGACGEGQVCSGPSATPSASARASATPSPTPLRGAIPPGLQCYEWPDGSVTQSFDPQSPPCISVWDDSKGNGGATTKGVSGTEIRVAMPIQGTLPSWPTLKPIVDFFNTRFQLYGRKITIVPYQSQQAAGQYDGSKTNDPSLQRADAAQVSKLGVFATLDFLDAVPYSWALPSYLDSLTKNKIVSINGGASPPYGTESDLLSHAPYAWSYYPTVDTLMRNAGLMICRQLAGRKASHSQDPEIAAKTRTFALMFPTDVHFGGPIPGLRSLLNVIDGCGVHDPALVRYEPNDDNTLLAQTEQIRKLQEDGITSLIFFPHVGSKAREAPMTLADRVDYAPEWVTIGWNKYLTDIWSSSPEREKRGLFGIGIWNKEPQLDLEMWHQSFMAAGGDATSANSVNDGLAFYNEMLLLASGLQMAGPNLTPQSFAAGLQGTEFPNPGAGSAPFYQATVGFQGDAAMTNDFNQFWFDPDTNWDTYSPQTGLNFFKAECYTGLGGRWANTWPTTDHFFQGACR